MKPCVYLTWDGPGSRYLRSLYLPLFAKLPFRMDVVQVTYGDTEELDATREMAAQLGIEFRGCHFERGRNTAETLARGARLLAREAWRATWADRERIVIPRALVPGAAAIMVGVPRNRLVFDADGLVVDERVEFGSWPAGGPMQRSAHAVERMILRRARVTLTRTRGAQRLLEQRAGVDNVFVAPNGSDEKRFVLASDRHALRAQRGYGPDDMVVIYCGSIGTQYRPDLMAAFVDQLRACRQRGDVHFRVLSGSVQAARQLAQQVGARVASVDPTEVPAELACADVALAFRQPSVSQSAVAPIKVAEYLLCGVPVVTNRGVGDLDSLLDDTCAIFSELTDEGVRNSAQQISARSFDSAVVRAVGLRHFSLGGAAEGYARAIMAAQ